MQPSYRCLFGVENRPWHTWLRDTPIGNHCWWIWLHTVAASYTKNYLNDYFVGYKLKYYVEASILKREIQWTSSTETCQHYPKWMESRWAFWGVSGIDGIESLRKMFNLSIVVKFRTLQNHGCQSSFESQSWEAKTEADKVTSHNFKE